MHETILVVDDEPKMNKLICLTLETAGYATIEGRNGREAITKVREDLPDLVLLDVMMPEMDGFATLKQIRAASNVPVIMLTVQASENDKVHGLELGADDYIAKPFSNRELLSRVKAALRRAEMPPTLDNRQKIQVDEHLQVDFDHRQVIVDGEPVKLRPTEYKLLYHLITNAGRLLNHETLLTRVWGREYSDDTQLLRLYITYLRQKIEPDPANPLYILNERGAGYRFRQL